MHIFKYICWLIKLFNTFNCRHIPTSNTCCGQSNRNLSGPRFTEITAMVPLASKSTSSISSICPESSAVKHLAWQAALKEEGCETNRGI